MTDERDDKLIRMAAEMPTEVSPGRDLWPDIEAAITKPARPWFTPLVAQAAAVVLLVGASSGLTYLAVKDDRGPTMLPAADSYSSRVVAFGSNHNLGPGFMDARGSSKARLQAEIERLSPESREEVLKNLEVIREAINDINAALEEDPDNAMLQELLLRTYREELEVMREVGGLTQSVMSRSDI